MFDVLIMRKKEVRIRCGNDELQGVITQYYPEFELIKMNNIMIPIGLIEQIDILDWDEPSPSPNTSSRPVFGMREPHALHLVAQAGYSK